MKKLTLNLLENSQSFVAEALNKAVEAEKDPSSWKFAVLNIVQAIELSLKEMLRIEHRVLIYKNIDKLTHTVTMEEALKRLDTILDFQLSNKEKETLKSAQDIRNNIVHHEFEIRLDVVKLTINYMVERVGENNTFGKRLSIYKRTVEKPRSK